MDADAHGFGFVVRGSIEMSETKQGKGIVEMIGDRGDKILSPVTSDREWLSSIPVDPPDLLKSFGVAHSRGRAMTGPRWQPSRWRAKVRTILSPEPELPSCRTSPPSSPSRPQTS